MGRIICANEAIAWQKTPQRKPRKLSPASPPPPDDGTPKPPPFPLPKPVMATSNFVAPNQFRQLRACMVCSVVQTGARFLADGCPNCDFLDLKGLSERVQDCTSQVYEGLLTVADPERSWVARWQRLDKYKPGVYAVKVVGTLPDEVLQDIEDAGVRYVPRDGSAQDDEQ